MSYDRWKSLMGVFEFPENQLTYEALIKAYSEKHRAYHTFDHIAACLRHFDAAKDQLDHPHEVELALWFHDAIYKLFSSSNEKDSAIWAQEFFELNEFEDDDVIDRVFDLIMVTEHSGATKTTDEELMIDIDLSILGTAPETYDQFEKDVRFEYKRVPGFMFRKKRREILSEFLERDRIYHDPYFHDKLEAQARVNLANAIGQLS
jgi:predicted metal-dependent HD superfamily phosphohydrolase